MDCDCAVVQVIKYYLVKHEFDAKIAMYAAIRHESSQSANPSVRKITRKRYRANPLTFKHMPDS